MKITDIVDIFALTKEKYGEAVRISLANLNRGDYTEIARRLFELLDEYYEESQIAADKEA